MKKPTAPTTTPSTAALVAAIKQVVTKWGSALAMLRKLPPTERREMINETSVALSKMNYGFTGIHELPRAKEDAVKIGRVLTKSVGAKR